MGSSMISLVRGHTNSRGGAGPLAVFGEPAAGDIVVVVVVVFLLLLLLLLLLLCFCATAKLTILYFGMTEDTSSDRVQSNQIHR